MKSENTKKLEGFLRDIDAALKDARQCIGVMEAMGTPYFDESFYKILAEVMRSSELESEVSFLRVYAGIKGRLDGVQDWAAVNAPHVFTTTRDRLGELYTSADKIWTRLCLGDALAMDKDKLRKQMGLEKSWEFGGESPIQTQTRNWMHWECFKIDMENFARYLGECRDYLQDAIAKGQATGQQGLSAAPGKVSDRHIKEFKCDRFLKKFDEVKTGNLSDFDVMREIACQDIIKKVIRGLKPDFLPPNAKKKIYDKYSDEASKRRVDPDVFMKSDFVKSEIEKLFVRNGAFAKLLQRGRSGKQSP